MTDSAGALPATVSRRLGTGRSRDVQRILAAGLLLVGAFAIWLMVFFGTAYAAVRLVEAVEGDTSECWSSQCAVLGEFQDDHDLLAVIVMGLLAALPAAAFLWRAWPRFPSRAGEPS